MRAYRYKIPFKQPVRFKGQLHSIREGIVLERDGQWAEASPLPGFSVESIDDVVSALKGVNSDATETLASLDFALTSLDNPMPDRLKISYNGLLMGEQNRILAQAKEFAESGIRAVKLKVGRGEVSQDIQLVRHVRECLPPNVQLRVDANQSWSFKNAVRFIDALQDVDWEYIEEPLEDPGQLEALYDQTGVAYALDETLVESESLENWPHVATLICKPTILGGRATIQRLAETGKQIVFSSAFESGIGIARVMQLASEFSPELPAGLDTLDFMSHDLMLCSPYKREGDMIVEALAIDEDCLERV